ncbi:hypothetical protein [Holzapfeliella sp. JNUCC 80]
MKRNIHAIILITLTTLFSICIKNNDVKAISAPVPANKVATVNYVKGYGIATWANVQSQASITGHYLPTKSQWLVNTTVKGFNNHSWYLVGNNEWASEKYYDLGNENSIQNLDAIVVTDCDTPTYSFANGKSGQVTGYLKKGEQYKTYKRQVSSGITLYQLGENQWVCPVSLLSEKNRGEKTFFAPSFVAKNGFVLDY